MSDEKKTKVTLEFLWLGFNPDRRPYKPSNPTIHCEHKIAIEVPLSVDLIANANDILTNPIMNETEETPILTPLGMRYCIDQFEIAMSNGEENTEETEKEDTSSWDDIDEDESPKADQGKKSSKSKKSDDWDDFDTEKKDNDEENWDENWES